MKKITAFFLVIVLLFSFLSIEAFASETDESVLPETVSLFMKESIASGEVLLDAQLLQKLEICDVIYKSLSSFNMTISLADFKLTWRKDENLIRGCLSYVIDMYPELFWFFNANPKFNINNDKSGYIKNLVFYYTPTVTDKNQVKEYYQLIDSVVQSVPKSASDVEKLLYIYNYLSSNYEYDLTYTNYDAYSFLKEKTGVCDAYAKTFMVVAERVGIPVTRALFMKKSTDSDKLQNHAWNIVKLNGKNYHIDNTWGDPTPDIYGRVSHIFFLLDSESLKARDESGNHSRYETSEKYYLGIYNVVCGDYEYAQGKYFWEDKESVLGYYNGNFYFIEYSNAVNGNAVAGIYRTDGLLKKDKKSVTFVKSKLWKPMNSTGYFTAFFSAVYLIDSQIYYNTEDSIMCYDILTDKSFKVADLSDYDSLYSMTYLGNSDFGVATVEFVPTSTGDYALYITSGVEVSLESVGDINQNGTLGGADDMISLRKYLLNGDSRGLCLVNADLSGNDKIIDIKDLVKMKKQAALI